jgi:lysophospholipase L1-like esterase
VWTVEVKPVGGSYTLLATVNFTPFNGTGGATKVNLTGLDATRIESIRFTAGSTAGNSAGNDFVFREIDVEGNATPEPLRIMCLGDSLTVGYTDNPNWTHPFEFGYRSGLYTRLTNAGYNFQFVGGSAEPWNGKSGDPTYGGTYKPALDLRDFGQDGHRGFSGQGIWNNVDGYIAADNPDVILLLIGINGLGSGSQAALSNLVDSIVTTAPDVHLIVAQTSPLVSFDQTLHDYNVYIRDTLVPTYAANGHKVSTVDLYTPFIVDPNNYGSAIKAGVLSNNNNHPDKAHYELMAQEWFEGIQALGLGSDNFDSWISDPAFGLAVADQDFDDDSDGDQLGNGIEAWFGTHPGQFNTGLANLSTDGNTTTFNHPQNATLPSDLTGYYEWSPNLADWYRSGNGPDGGGAITFSSITAGTTTTVTATASEGLDRAFLRVGVSQD